MSQICSRDVAVHGFLRIAPYETKGNSAFNIGSYDDILFSATKTPEIHVRQVRMKRDGQIIPLIENYEPSAYLLNIRKNP